MRRLVYTTKFKKDYRRYLHKPRHLEALNGILSMSRGQVNDISEITTDCADYTDFNECTRRHEDTKFLSLRENLDSLRILGF